MKDIHESDEATRRTDKHDVRLLCTNHFRRPSIPRFDVQKHTSPNPNFAGTHKQHITPRTGPPGKGG
jgi:hypothetical protein